MRLLYTGILEVVRTLSQKFVHAQCDSCALELEVLTLKPASNETR